MVYYYRGMRDSLTSAHMAEEERYSAVLRQSQEAERVKVKAGELLEKIRKRRT